MNAHADKLVGTAVDAICPVISNLGALAEQATRGRIVRILAFLVVVRHVMPAVNRLDNAYVAYLKALLESRRDALLHDAATR